MKFRKRNVKFLWSKKLEGKKGYVSTNINGLIEMVEGKCCADITTVQPSDYDAAPFKDDLGYNYRFFYPVRSK